MTTRLVTFTGLAIGAPLLIAADKVVYAEPHLNQDSDKPSFDGTILTVADPDGGTAQVVVADAIDVVADKLGAFSQVDSIRKTMTAWTPANLQPHVRERLTERRRAAEAAASEAASHLDA